MNYMLVMSRFVGHFMKDVLASMPLSLIMKLGDGKLTNDEMQELAKEVANSAMKCLVLAYNESNDKTVKVPHVEDVKA